MSCEPSARPPERPFATILQPKSVRFDGVGWGRLIPGGTAVAGSGRLTSSTDVRFSGAGTLEIGDAKRAVQRA
jgi:hypothetical protein